MDHVCTGSLLCSAASGRHRGYLSSANIFRWQTSSDVEKAQSVLRPAFVCINSPLESGEFAVVTLSVAARWRPVVYGRFIRACLLETNSELKQAIFPTTTTKKSILLRLI